MDAPARPDWARPILVDCPQCPARRGQRCQTTSGYTTGYHNPRKTLVKDMTAAQAAESFAALDEERRIARREQREHQQALLNDPAVVATRTAVQAAVDLINRETLAAERRDWTTLDQQ